MTENVDLNELVEDFYEKIALNKKYLIVSAKMNTVYFLKEGKPVEIGIEIKPLSYNNDEEILKHADAIREWRNRNG